MDSVIPPQSQIPLLKILLHDNLILFNSSATGKKFNSPNKSYKSFLLRKIRKRGNQGLEQEEEKRKREVVLQACFDLAKRRQSNVNLTLILYAFVSVKRKIY